MEPAIQKNNIYTTFTVSQLPNKISKERSYNMDGKQRREKLIQILQMQTEPISGTQLSKQLGVSRQIIVQDIALIRAEQHSILSTTKGYLMVTPKQSYVSRYFKVKHKKEEIEDELITIIHYGGKIKNVMIEHPTYGKIITDLFLATEEQVKEFIAKINAEHTVPLYELTKGVHSHKVEAESEEILEKIEQALKEKKYLIK